MKMYRVSYCDKIVEREIVRKTEKQVVYLNSRGTEEREAIKSGWHNWFDTKEEAAYFLIKRYEDEIQVCKRKIADAELSIENIKQL
jgi:hypothetical protein